MLNKVDQLFYLTRISFVNEKMAIYAANENIPKLIITIIEICETEKIMFNEMSFLLRRLYVPLCLSLGCTRHLSCDQLWQDTNLFSHDKSNSLQSLIHSWCCEDNRKFCFDSSLYALLVSTSTLNSTFQLATKIEQQCFNILDIASDTSSIYKWEFSMIIFKTQEKCTLLSDLTAIWLVGPASICTFMLFS